MAATTFLAVSLSSAVLSLISRRTLSPPAGLISPISRFLTGTPRRISFDCSTSNSAFILNSPSAASSKSPSARRKSIDALEPLKSYRWAISFCAWLTALSTSCRSTPVVTSNELVVCATLPEIRFQRPGATDVAQSRQRLLFDLSHPFAGDPHERSDLLEGHGFFPVQTKIQT